MVAFFRLMIVLILGLIGFMLGHEYGAKLEGAAAGVLLGFMVSAAEYFLRRFRLGRVVGGIVGLFFGIVLARLIIYPIERLLGEINTAAFIFEAVSGYTGLLLGLTKGEGLTAASFMRIFRGQNIEENIKIIDTSSIIDGRIADVCETGFLEGTFIVPQFILQELQHIADSSDSMKRSRGRRGLDVLHRMQKFSTINVRIVEEEFQKIREVDSKLVALAKMMNAKIITNDFNLNKVAQLQDVPVLNINELANALKPVVLPGEMMKVFIIKEGKESNQGVAYTDDGTMVVVENARKLIGKNVEVVVTSVLQTTAGRMIFSKSSSDY
ncbi:PIN/TRAM domain-containing protein [Candidatus Magnetobacterium casense]|uniref:TRAM domain-containing protein n=1 Tax=Candidatus Magnetobacterium casense TaxID=1455061 RepID=A0ABS6RZR6_9BACT|nr:PIN domain-containing protein [Candidatus Magnetobacterium casensis]MBV6341633.1 TRAM domain-containing protein [Candidatus Magnetobacterium casensis]